MATRILKRFTPSRDGLEELAELIAFFVAMALAYRVSLTKNHDIIEGFGIIAAGVFASFMVRTLIRQSYIDAARRKEAAGKPLFTDEERRELQAKHRAGLPRGLRELAEHADRARPRPQPPS